MAQPKRTREEFERRFPLPIRSERKLASAIYYLFGVVIPSWSCCPHHSTPWQALADGFFARTPVVIWKASRGFGGKSFLLSILGSMLAIAEHAEVNVLGGSLEQSTRVLETLDRLWAFPALDREGLVASQSARKIELVTGASLKAQAASHKSVRGGHPQRLLLDEIDEMDRTIFDAAQGQTMDRAGVMAGVVGASTQQYPRGTMHHVMREAVEKGWKVHEWCYRESVQTDAAPWGWLQQDEVDRKLQAVPEAMRLAEYEGFEPEAEGLSIERRAVEQAFKTELGEFSGLERGGFELEPPDALGEYSHGTDWAKEVDRTVIVTLRTDVRPARLVAWWAGNKEPYPKMAARLDERVQRYEGRACHDRTGIGNVVHDLLGHDAEGVRLVGRDRSDLLVDYIAGMERDEIVAPRIALAYDEHRYATNDDLFGTGHLPDTLCAMALAYRAAFGRRFAWASA